MSLNTSLARLDQFSYDTKTYNSNPVTINYTQPLRSFNTLKWQKKTEPLQYEKAKKQYLESLEGITLQTTSYFFSVLSAQTSYRKSEENLRSRIWNLLCTDCAGKYRWSGFRLPLAGYGNGIKVCYNLGAASGR